MEGEFEPIAEKPAENSGQDGASAGSVGAVTPPPSPPQPAYPPPPPAPPAYAAPPPQPPAYAPPPSAPPSFGPPTQQYAAPAQPQPVYAPPPAPAGYGAPPAYAPVFQAPPARRAGRGRVLLVIGIIAVFLIAALGGGAIFANAQLSTTYSPQRAVTDYFAALGRGDVSGMMSNAQFLPGDPSYSQYFGKDAAKALVAVDQNRQISQVSVASTQPVDDVTSTVKVSLTWGGTPRSLTYTVHKDTSRVHYLFYDSWRVDIPYTTITVTLPNQPGSVQVDDVSLPASSQNKVQAIQGFHKVTMLTSDFYDQSSQVADAVESTAAVTFPGTISAAATSAAATSIKAAFNNVTCDVTKYFDCPNHKYNVPAGYYDNLPAPGGDIRANSNWSLTFTGDATTAMVLVITNEAGKLTASGKCAMTLTVDGSKTYHFTGTWTGTLTWSSGAFSSHVLEDCDAARA